MLQDLYIFIFTKPIMIFKLCQRSQTLVMKKVID